ncbi:hypothetical protein [Spirosoma endbachense]|uniref:Uncharacterized protein n=1 Tax=Spirosoma endbachense TaxID=2666025 RepID=A0A6P1VS44_9BACT|nr:hypothetical protein [Spirosoma endbachense]QHV94547.1 hypothetical protein GJR95_05745 [Spirosoma endbachense]
MNRTTHTPRFVRPLAWLLVCILLTASCQDHQLPQPNYNLDVTLLGAGKASGFVKFRQFPENPFTIYLDTSVQGLEPTTNYGLQRAVDTNLDGNCTSTSWLTLGKGLVAQPILTDNLGAGKAALFRDVSAFAPGTTFDIHFQIINLQTSAVVLTSTCYQYTVR